MRLRALGTRVLLLAMVLAACQGDAVPEAGREATETVVPRVTPTASSGEPGLEVTPSPDATPSPSAEPTTRPGDTDSRGAAREAELEELRATNHFLEFAEADRAKHATWARFAYDHFAPYEDGEVQFEWANKSELWNSMAPRVRDECLLAGREIRQPMWDAEVVIPASLNPRWSNIDTDGRGFFVDFSCMYTLGRQRAELWIGVLIQERGQHGRIAEVSPAITFFEHEHTTMDEVQEHARSELWDWVLTQPIRRQVP